jgi:hypothetical protein
MGCKPASQAGRSDAARTLYSNDERHVIHAERPIVLSGIDEFVRKGGLADRGVFLHLQTIIMRKRRELEEFWERFRGLEPKILGGLLDAVAGALRELPAVRPAELPRMADVARFEEAVGRGLDWATGRVLATYMENRRDAALSSM